MKPGNLIKIKHTSILFNNFLLKNNNTEKNPNFTILTNKHYLIFLGSTNIMYDISKEYMFLYNAKHIYYSIPLFKNIEDYFNIII